jgi:hypothetical protein
MIKILFAALIALPLLTDPAAARSEFGGRPGFAGHPGFRPGFVHRPFGRPHFVHRPLANRFVFGFGFVPGIVVGPPYPYLYPYPYRYPYPYAYPYRYPYYP